MMRALWTGASGMIAQQDAVDTISNNLSNVNTTGYKKETVEFKSLLYSKLQTKTTDTEGNPKPVIGQVGAGVRTYVKFAGEDFTLFPSELVTVQYSSVSKLSERSSSRVIRDLWDSTSRVSSFR